MEEKMESESLISTLLSFFSFSLFVAVLRGATPLIFAALGGLLSERAGVIQIALEGMMLIGALMGAVGGYYFSSPWVGFICGALAGGVAASLFGFFSITLKTDQIIAGTGLNLLAVGVSPFITKIIFNSTGSTPSLPMENRFSFEPILIALIVALVIGYIFYQTKAGLLWRFAGEEPMAVQSSGFSVSRIRWLCVVAAGMVTGMGGASLSLFLASSYSPNMTAGRGFMALAALIFGKWKPGPTLAACFFFAFIDSIQVRLQGVPTGIPVQWIQILPYLVTIVALAGFFGQSRAPRALGKHAD